MEGWPPRDWPAQEFLLRNHGDNIMVGGASVAGNRKLSILQAEVVAAALLGGLMEFLTSHVSTLRFSETRADACTRPFELEAKIDEKDSSRYRSFEQVVLRAQVLLQNHAGALPRPQESTGSEWIEWLGNIYSRILHLPLTKLAMQLRLRGHRTFIAGFDECRLLNKPTSSLNTPRSDMSLIALHRVIQAAGQKTIPDFSFWFTFLDTSSSISLLVPRKGVQAPSIRLGGYLEPLPAFPFLGYDQMAPKEPSKTPQEALQVERLRRYGRPVSLEIMVSINVLIQLFD